MTLTQPEAPTSTQRMSTPVTSWMPFAVALTAALALAVFILLPFYANGLHHLPLDKVAVGTLTNILEAKGTLIKKALGIDDLRFDVAGEHIA